MTDDAVSFLERFHPKRPWVLSAIWPERSEKPGDGHRRCLTKAFPYNPKQSAAARAFIEEHDGRRNLYFHPCTPMKLSDKKIEDANVGVVYALHVDVDARKGHDLASELGRIRELLEGAEPSMLNYTGGGFQAFWRLEEPVHVMGNAEAVEEVALRNERLAQRLSGDKCHAPSWLMRLPGTQNIPDKGKVARGRVQVEARNVSFTDRMRPLASFEKAVPKANTEATADATRVDTLDGLDVSDRVKMILSQGSHPDESPKDSRSEWLFDAVCQMVRQNIADEIILGILTDERYRYDYVTGQKIPDDRGGFQRVYRIAESVVEKPDPLKYARRQLARAKDKVEADWLYRLNDKHAVIGNLGGKCRVVEEVYDDAVKRARLVKQSFEDFRNRYMNERETIVDGDNLKSVPIGKLWLEHPRRRQYERIVFAPEREVEGAYNLWRGFEYKPTPGRGHIRLLGHIKRNLCRNDREHYDYFIRWLARAVQNPDSQGHTAIVMRGRQGTGKSFLAKQFGKLFGRHFLHVTTANHLVGQFNGHLRDAVIVFGDEAFYAGDTRHESTLKTLVTEDTLMIETKGVDAEPSANYTHMLLASNQDWVVPTDADDRRFFVVDVAEDKAKNRAYFERIARDLESGGYENLLHYLATLDLSDFDVTAVPDSKAKDAQKLLSLNRHQKAAKFMLDEGLLPDLVDRERQVLDGAVYVVTNALPTWLEQQGHKGINVSAIGKELSKMRPDNLRSKMCLEGQERSGQWLPPLAVARVSWEKKTRLRIEWDENVTDWVHVEDQTPF